MLAMKYLGVRSTDTHAYWLGGTARIPETTMLGSATSPTRLETGHCPVVSRVVGTGHCPVASPGRRLEPLVFPSKLLELSAELKLVGGRGRRWRGRQRGQHRGERRFSGEVDGRRVPILHQRGIVSPRGVLLVVEEAELYWAPAPASPRLQ